MGQVAVVAERTKGFSDGALGEQPSRVPLVVRVGVIADRRGPGVEPDTARLIAQARQSLEQIARIAGDIDRASGEEFSAGRPRVVMVSTLTTVEECLVVREALQLGYLLECPLPFARDRLSLDDAELPNSDLYVELIGQATAVLELDGSAASLAAVAEAYTVAYQTMLAHSDVLIARWDGEEGRGGPVGRTVLQARLVNTPVIWLQAQPPHDVRLLTGGFEPNDLPLEQLADILPPALVPPAGLAAEGMEIYFAETFPGWSALGGVWPFFHDLLGRNRVRWPHLRGTAREDARTQWAADWNIAPRLPECVTTQIDRALEPHFIWADTLASHYVSLYRSSFILIGLLAVVAVLMGVIGDATGWSEHYARFEVVRRLIAVGVLLTIMLLWRLGNRHRWHQRGIDYRFLAEELRQLRYLAPLGRVPAFANLKAHEDADDPEKTWMGWHARAVTRAMGLVRAEMTPEYLHACHTLLRDGLIGGQASYHRAAAHRYERVEHRLHRLGFLTFVGTLMLLLATFVIELPGVLLLEVVLPALGATLGAIRSQAELERLAKRSLAMSRYLEKLEERLEAAGDSSSSTMAHMAELATEALAAEVSDWRIVFQSKPLDLPG